jgi:hypothetical protein
MQRLSDVFENFIDKPIYDQYVLSHFYLSTGGAFNPNVRQRQDKKNSFLS